MQGGVPHVVLCDTCTVNDRKCKLVRSYVTYKVSKLNRLNTWQVLSCQWFCYYGRQQMRILIWMATKIIWRTRIKRSTMVTTIRGMWISTPYLPSTSRRGSADVSLSEVRPAAEMSRTNTPRNGAGKIIREHDRYGVTRHGGTYSWIRCKFTCTRDLHSYCSTFGFSSLYSSGLEKLDQCTVLMGGTKAILLKIHYFHVLTSLLKRKFYAESKCGLEKFRTILKEQSLIE